MPSSSARTRTGPAATTQEPPVVPLAPGRGWAEADGPRRAAAVLALPLALAASASCAAAAAVESAVPAVLVWAAWLLVGPASFYSLARVLRPHPGTDRRRTARHLLASAAAALGAPLLLLLVLQPQDGDPVRFVAFYVGWGVPAAVLALLTASWGATAALVALSGSRSGRGH